MKSLPEIELYLHAGEREIDADHLTNLVQEALPLCLSAKAAGDALLADLPVVEISLVDDTVIAEIHDKFMGDPSPTDVITFQHGEILVSVETARREGPKHENSLERETFLYIVHGLLHLNGHTDADEKDRVVMHREQDAILDRVLPQKTSAFL